MQKTKYDLIFGIGTVCSCSQTLRRANLQFLSFPGDWTSPVCGYYMPASNLHVRVDWLCRGFEGFFNHDDFKFVRTIEETGKDAYANTKTNYIFNHDIPAGADFDKELPRLVSKYEHRRNRLVSLIHSAHRVLVLRLDYPNGSDPTALEDCGYAHDLLLKTFPNASFDIALIQPEFGRPATDPKIESLAPWLTRITFDYRRAGADPNDKLYPDLNLTSLVVRNLYSVRDYRTAAEKRAHLAAVIQKRIAKTKARLAHNLTKVLSVFRRSDANKR